MVKEHRKHFAPADTRDFPGTCISKDIYPSSKIPMFHFVASLCWRKAVQELSTHTCPSQEMLRTAFQDAFALSMLHLWVSQSFTKSNGWSWGLFCYQRWGRHSSKCFCIHLMRNPPLLGGRGGNLSDSSREASAKATPASNWWTVQGRLFSRG